MAWPLSWTGQLAYYAAGFGPLASALLVTWALGRPVGAWARGLFRWRVPSWSYLFALGFPGLLVAVVAGLLTGLGQPLDLSALPGRLAAYAPSLLVLALVGGGNEEPGWRGFALPELLARRRPMEATAILGLVWALWHLPLIGLNEDVASGLMPPATIAVVLVVTLLSITLHAFWYSWLYNRTGSVLLCALLHASYNASNALLPVPAEALRGDGYLLPLGLMTGVLGASVLGLMIATRGRLGWAPMRPDP